ncbi:hypothetical protein DLREEDagr8_02610 [Dongia sp. agr-C8]
MMVTGRISPTGMSAFGASAAGSGFAAAGTGAAAAPNGLPQPPQNRSSAAFSKPQAGQGAGRG